MARPTPPRGEERDTQESPVPDRELVQKIAQRDERSLSLLYDRHASLLLSVAAQILGDRTEAEDVLQRVFVKIWRDAARYDSAKASVRVWLVSCARHAAIDQLRRRDVQSKGARQAAARGGPPEIPPDPAHLEDRQRRVVQALESLPPDQRDAIALAYFEGLSQSQIAERLKEPLGTVKTRIRLGMNRLREALTGLVEERK